jgi:hypothetical protein
MIQSALLGHFKDRSIAISTKSLSAVRTFTDTMADEKLSVEMIDQKKAPIHFSTIDGDITLDSLVIEERETKEKALVRKVDIRMMPLMMLLCKYSYYQARPL